MGLKDRFTGIFKRNKIVNKVEENRRKEDFEVVINDIDTFALYIKNREMPYILIRDAKFPFMLNNPDIEWIEMNKNKFEFYGEFRNMAFMFEKLQKLYNEEMLSKKKENDYLIDYLEHSNSGYSKIIDKMQEFEIDKKQHDILINNIKNQIENSINLLYNNYEKSNKNLETNRTYKEIMDNLMSMQEFTEKYPYEFYKKIQYKEGRISHCGYPDYMWQSGAEGTYINLAPIPNSTNYVFEYNKFVGGMEDDGYITEFAIVSNKEKDTILEYWDKILDRHEEQFEIDFMTSMQKNMEEKEKQEDEEDEEEM